MLYLHPQTSPYSAIDLPICESTIYFDYDWKVHDDNCGSGHFLIISENSASQPVVQTTHWNIKRA